jgi:SAM-dependent methyltransferase/predicted metal-dependent enzyme (double-stranded beta helix superfamily)
MTTSTSIEYPVSIQTMIEELQKKNNYKPAELVRILRSAEIEVEDLKAWTNFDHPEEDSYGRKLVFKAPHFEIMVMSWKPGDFSAIHDHGYTQWGAVKIFGPAEHATFRVEDGRISTLARWNVSPGDVIGVGHSLIHQMGNPTQDEYFISLHVYGDFVTHDNITGDARIYDLEEESILRVDGGVFFALPEEKINRRESGPKPDFPTLMRYRVEFIKRLERMKDAGAEIDTLKLETSYRQLFSLEHQGELIELLQNYVDEYGHYVDSAFWKMLNREFQMTSELQSNKLRGDQDKFHKYAELYDQLIGKPCLEDFIGPYLKMLEGEYLGALRNKKIISLGCGTGLVEAFMLEHLEVNKSDIYGIDISASMVDVARKRIKADKGDVLTLDPALGRWDIAYSGLNVFQYLDYKRIEEAIQKTSAIIHPGGYFIGDFITPDHIRWYPNVMFSEDKQVVSLRTPKLIEEDGRIFQESEITNISFLEDRMIVNYSGRHKRFLPPIHRVRMYFEKAFGGMVKLFDAKSLQEIPDWADSCASTRYVLLAQKQ